MASVLVDGLEIEVDGFVCVPAPRDGAHVAIRFRTGAVLHDVAGLSLRRDVHLGFEVSGSVYQGMFRLTAFTPEPGPRQYRFASVDPIVVSLR
jgi:hypothetical protein